MADLFSMKSPLMVRFENGESRVMAEYFRHPQGLLYFDVFWPECWPDRMASVVHLVEGEYKGEGPWKIGGAVISVLGCHGCDADLATQFADWQNWLQMQAKNYPANLELASIARQFGAM